MNQSKESLSETKIKEQIEKLEFSLMVCETTDTQLVHVDRADAKIILDTLILALKEQEPHELTKEEWEEWKKDKYNRDPICGVWYGDTTSFWVLKPEDINEVIYLMGKNQIIQHKTKERANKMGMRREQNDIFVREFKSKINATNRIMEMCNQ